MIVSYGAPLSYAYQRHVLVRIQSQRYLTHSLAKDAHDAFMRSTRN